MNILSDPRFAGITPFESPVWLSSPTMHGDELKWVEDAINQNQITTAGDNVVAIEQECARLTARKYAVALSSGTTALHMAIRLAGERIYGTSKVNHGMLEGRKVFCSDLTFDATINPIAYEGGEAVLIDSEYDTWNMDPVLLEEAFNKYPEVKLVVLVHLFGIPGKLDEILEIAHRHGALVVEDSAESFGATYHGRQTGGFGDYSVLSFNGNKIITGSSGGIFLTDSEEDAAKVRKWSTQAKEDAPWYQHEELGFNYRMSNIIAGVIRGQLPYLTEHIAQKKAIYERYREGLKDLPVKLNPIPNDTEPNYWFTCLTVDPEAMCEQLRTDRVASFVSATGKSCPTEVLEVLKAFNAEGRPIWKPMHMQPIYEGHSFIKGNGIDVGEDIFERGLCLPSDNKMTAEQQDRIINIIRCCFGKMNPVLSFRPKGEIPSGIPSNRQIPFSPPDISEAEIAEVSKALRSGWITTGPRTKLLERRLAAYIETGRTDIDTETEPARWDHRVVCLNSATAAEELNLRILGIREGDEVIVPAYTYTATASAVLHCGATVKFVDIQQDGDHVSHAPEMDYDKLEQAITERTKAVIPVDLGGIVCDYDKIYEIVERKKNIFTPMDDHSDPLSDLGSRIQQSIGRVVVLADCAHSLGASRIIDGKRMYCGAIADFTSFSFHAVKNFTTAEGGASTWKPIAGVPDEEIYKMYQLLSLHGQNKDALAKTKVGAWEYDIIGPWYKCNMTDVMAAIGLRQLDRYKQLLERRKQIISRYDRTCDKAGIQHLTHYSENGDSSGHLYLIRIPGATDEERRKIIVKLAERGISTNVHYKPLPMMSAYKNLDWDITDFPKAFDYYQNLITLPLHTLLSDEDVDYICSTLEDVLKEIK